MNPWGKFVRKTACPAHHHVLARTTLAIRGPVPVAAHIYHPYYDPGDQLTIGIRAKYGDCCKPRQSIPQLASL